VASDIIERWKASA